ncbi:hypothetical protein QFZ77_002915 [Paenibacillus sp. V4I3]|uniref:stalk domain-containing protein n=1 Tax=Paenibacillus sp. V4I3 TaxID=3042305 RepID=UPI00278ABB13|nr:stalk domain-containing protein [Paenibacillus sp. V4I3]MDQ0874256.1 hypothetical protein [Paenibacillus sp. V4I3]
MKKSFKRITIAILSVAILGVTFNQAEAVTITFNDVSPSFWGYSNIQWAIENKIVDGYPDSSFKPNQNVEQAEFIAMLIRAYQPSDYDPTSETGEWSAPYIRYANKMKWKVVTPSSLGGHTSPVYLNRGMVAQYLANATGKNYSTDDSIQYLLDLGLSEGKTDKNINGFQKGDEVTRTEAITFIERLKTQVNTLQASSLIEEKYDSMEDSNAAKDISIWVKNKQLQIDSPPVNVEGTVLVPLRDISESLGASVEWNQEQKTAIVTKWSKKISLTIGEKTAWVENSAVDEEFYVWFEVSVRTINNRVYVPLRLIAEQLGYKVDYNGNIVSIQSPYAGRYNENYFAQILSGDLERSRSILTANMGAYGLRNYENPPLKTIQPASRVAFLFPEGEALRFFMIENNETITFFEYKDDFFVATWQANVEQIEGNAAQQLFTDKLKDRTGSTPKINKPFLYFYVEPYGLTVHRSGRIDVDGKYTETGYKNEREDVTNSFGTISLVLPNEARKEIVTIPQS